MIILTSAHSDIANSYERNEIFKGFSFKKIIQSTIEKAESCGYKSVVYDLGTLGIGEPYKVLGESFNKKGFYKKEPEKGYKSKALFKPEIVKKCMKDHEDLVVYVDADAQLCDNIDEVNTDDYDIGVTLRDRTELDSEWHQKYFDIVKFLNAGVIFFRPTEAANQFIERWEKLTYEVGNDQKALNSLACPQNYPKPGSIVKIDGVRIKYFPCKMYNFYYFETGLSSKIKIMHFKGDVRHFYPFDWKKSLYCRTIAPLLNLISVLKNKIIK